MITEPSSRPATDSGHELWFDAPATSWNEALPIGNGRSGAMIFGGIDTDRLQINDATAWSGTPESASLKFAPDAEAAQSAIAESRIFLEAGEEPSAARAIQQIQSGHTQSFQPFADLHVSVSFESSNETVTEYRRQLDLASAIHATQYRRGAHLVRTRAFASAPNNVLAYTIETDAPGGMDVSFGLSSPLPSTQHGRDESSCFRVVVTPADVAPPHENADNPIRFHTDPSDGLQGVVVVGWTHDGIHAEAATTEGVAAHGVRQATIIVATQTTYAGAMQPLSSLDDAHREARARVEDALSVSIETLEQNHREDYAALYERCSVTTGTDIAKPLDQRLRSVDASGGMTTDPALAGLLFNYGRYLLISSSRSGGLPANLQGIWNESMQPSWSSNYTTNINTEMNYWLAEVANLSECVEPLLDFLELLARSGAITAAHYYGAPGWVVHHNSDAWAFSRPPGSGTDGPHYMYWPMGGIWLLQAVWDRVAFGSDDLVSLDTFARERAWPLFRSAAEFYLDWLIPRYDGSYATLPSTSPENQFVQNGAVASVGISSTIDLSLISALFDELERIAELIGESDDPIVLRAREVNESIPGASIGWGDRIREWANDPGEVDVHHRHLSHLYFLYPGTGITTKELRAAASASLDARGDESTGWSLVWKIALRARLGQGRRISNLLRLLFRQVSSERGSWVGGIYPNLLVAHPPFQIDGNLGFTAALAECLLQSHTDAIVLLPALPPELAQGRVHGLVARPGIEVSIAWQGGALDVATLRARSSRADGQHKLAYGDRVVFVTLNEGEEISVTAGQFE